MRRALAIGALGVVIVVIAAVVYHWRPLIPSSSLQATCVERSIRRDARAYRMLFRPQIVFIELPARDHSSRSQWFALDLDRREVVFPTSRPAPFPYLHYNHDMNLGVPVDDTLKHDDLWQVSWSAGEVAWSYGDVTVRLQGT